MPKGLAEDGNQFARCIEAGPVDDQSFAHAPNTQDVEGNAYIFASGWVVDHFATLATGRLTQPAWGCVLKAAQEVQALIPVGGLAAPRGVLPYSPMIWRQPWL